MRPRLLQAALLALLSLNAAPSVSVARTAPRTIVGAGPRPVRALLREHRARSAGVAAVPRGRRLRFTGVGDRDVYNPSAPFDLAGQRLIAARVESRGSETDTRTMFFAREGAGRWSLVAGAPRFALQDPFVTRIGGQLVLGGVQVQRLGPDRLRWRTVFYRGATLQQLHPVARGPWGMKDVRLLELPDGRVFVLTRPQGKKGGRGKIGWMIIDDLSQLTPQRLARAPLIRGQFASGEWGGGNELTLLGRDRIGVLGHVARFDARGGRHYYPMTFTIDLAAGRASPLRLLLERRDLPRGLRGATKRRDLRDVVFPGGLRRGRGGRVTLTVGAGDAEALQVVARDPFRRSSVDRR